MSIRSIGAASLFLLSLSQCLAADYPAAQAARGEAPGAMAVDQYGYTYISGVLTASSGGHAAGSIYAARIDPSGATRLYTSYLNASGTRVTGAAVDQDGNLLITGYTPANGLRTATGVQKTSGGNLDAFVAKLDPKGESWLYTTYLGGSGDDMANAIAVDSEGNAYITGSTASADFPLRSATQSQSPVGATAFLAEISADGATLLHASYLGNGARSSGNGIAVNSSGVYVVGSIVAAGGGKQAFLLKTANDGASPGYFRMIDQGIDPGEATSIALDPQGDVYIAGSGPAVFAAKFNGAGERLYYTSIVGTDGEAAPRTEESQAAPRIAADWLGNAYVMSGRSGLLVKLSAAGDRQLASHALSAGGSAIGLAATGSGRAIAAGNGGAARVATCGLWLSQGAQAVAAEGGAASVAVESSPECDWQPAASAPWVEVSGRTVGSGTLNYRVAANHGPARTATIAVGDETVLVTQAAGASTAAASTIRDNPGFRTTSLASCDDCSSAQSVDLGFAVDFCGRGYSQVWVNANGNITFDAPDSSYRPEPLATLKSAMIAPFWADADTRRGSARAIQYGAADAVQYGSDTVDGHRAFAATWANVGPYAGHRDARNTFQLVLIERGDIGPGQFDIEMNYAGVEWDRGGASGAASARAGFTSGTGQAGTWLELAGSGENGALLDGGKDSLQGRHTFNVRPGVSSSAASSSSMAGTESNTASTASNIARRQRKPS